MKQDELERRLLDAAREYNAPPETPRDEMWAVIRAGMPDRDRRAPDDLGDRRAARERRERLRRWTPWALGLATAATLVVGFGLGRIAERSLPGVEAPGSGVEADRGASLPVRMATADHIGEAEAMLTLYRSSEREEDREATALWARELLTTTRLLLDSRAGRDPQLADLLEDLELVLVQIASAGPADGIEQEMIEEGMEQRQLLPKLRSAARPLERKM